MEDCPGSPEIDVVSDGDKSKRFHHRSEQYYSEGEATSQGRNSNSSSFRATNENGANLLAANTNTTAKQIAETVNLRVRNMGIINVKDEPESDEEDESSYSLSALLEECDFSKTPRRNKRPKSPTLSKTTTTKSVEPSRPGGTVQGRSRQSLENVISSLKSARAVNIDKPKPNGPSNTVSAPTQVTSTAPAPPKISGPQSSAPVNGSVPQIVDVRSLASVERPAPVIHSLQQMLDSYLKTGPQQKCTNSLSSTTTTHTPGTRGSVPGATQTAMPITPGVNIRFVLPPNVPFNTNQFQQVLQATLASISAQSRMVEPDQLEKAIQAALLSVTKSTVAFNPSQLQQAIHNSLASACGLSAVPQAAQKPLTPQAVYFPQTTQRQLQTIAPKPPSSLVQPQVTSGNSTIVTFEKQFTSTTSSTCTTNITASTQPVTKASDNTPVVNGKSNYQVTSEAPVGSSHLTSARNALIKALQGSRVLNRPASLSSATVSSPSSVTDSSAIPDSFDGNSISVSPTSSPVASLAEAPASNSRVNDRSSSATPACVTSTISAKSTTLVATNTCSLSVSTSESTPQTERGTPASITSIRSTLQAERATPLKPTSPPTQRVVTTVMSADATPQVKESTCTSVTSVVSTPQATRATPSIASAESLTQVTRSATSVTTAGSAAQATGVSTTATTTESVAPAARDTPSLTTVGSAVQGTRVSASNTIAGSTRPAAQVSPSAASVGSVPQGDRVAHTVVSTGSTFSPVIRSSPLVIIDPQTKQGQSSLPTRSQTSLLSVSAPLSSYKTSSATFSNINLHISLPANLASKSVNATANKTTAAPNKPPPSGCGCCSNCRFLPESGERYMCYFKGCGSVYHKESGLRKHHYFYPNHKPRIPLERASHSVEYFLPDDLNALHRTARLRELFKHLTDEEIKEHVLPHLSKTVSLFELLEIKSMRASTYRGKPNISAFKMFGEFERFRKEVEIKLMELISLPQGRGRTKVEQKEEEKLSTTAKEANTAETAKQEKKDVPPSITISDNQKTKSPTGQKKTALDSSPVSSETSKETPETFCVESEAERTAVSSDKAASSSIEDLPGQGSVSSDVIKNSKETTDLSLKEKKQDESDQESTESGPAQSSNKEGSKVSGSTVHPEEPSKTAASSLCIMSAVKDTVPLPMDTDVRQVKDVSEPGSGPSSTQSTGVVMVEAKENMESSSKGNPNVAQECVIEMAAVDKGNKESTAGKKPSSVRSSDGGSQEQARKQPTVVLEENKGEVDEVVEKEDSKSMEAGKDADKMASDCTGESGPTKSTESGGVQAKSNEKPSEATRHENVQVDEAETASLTTREPSSSNSSNPGDDSIDVQKETQKEASPLKQKFTRMLADITADEEDDIDESNLLEFGLPFAIKWGKVIRNARFLEVKKILRKESYSEQDMRQFIYSKPKEAANVVISSDCHAHPSFFRAYVMPALLDKHIDNFGLFGKKILSRLYLSKQKYVDVLRSGIGPEFAKILGINLFPTFKRIHDTWRSVKSMTPEEKIKRNLVLVPMAEDEHEVPEDEDEGPSTTNTANGMVTTSAVQGQGVTVQNPAIRAVGKHVQNTSIRPAGCTVQNNSPVRVVGTTVQSATGSGNNLLKRPSPAIAMQKNNSKKQRVDNSDAQKDSSQANQAQTEGSEKGAGQSNDADKGQKADDVGNSKNASKDTSQLDGKNKSKPNQDGCAEKQKETTAPSENKTRSGHSSFVLQKDAAPGDPKGPTVHSSSTSQKKPSTNSDHAYSKQPSTTSAACLIPKKATIYTSSGKQGPSQLPFPTAKGSPLYLVPVEKLSPKLVEQFINQAKGDGVKTRSASSANKGTQPKQGSQVFILIPSASPSGSPTIQTLTSEEQLKGDGDKKPLLLLPADKVPKSMASQSPSARRKMLITMVSPSCLSGSAALSAAQSVTTTSSSSTGSEQNVSSTTGQVAQGTIMSARESNTDSEATVPNAAAVCKVTSANRVSNDPKPSEESVHSSATTLASVASNTSVLNLSAKDTLPERAKKDVSVGPVDAGKTDSVPFKEATGTSDSELTNTCKSVGDSVANSELDILPSLLPSDFTLDKVLKDITGDGSVRGADEMLPLNVSEIVSSFEDLPVESDSHTATGMSCDAVTSPSDGVACDSDSDARKSGEGREGSAIEESHSTSFRRQSPRKAPTKSTPMSSLTDVSSPNTSGGSRENSDVEDGSPARKRRKTPTRASTRTSPQVTFVPDKGILGKTTYGLPSKSKGRKQ